MSHGIEKSDLIYSTSGTEWHGMAKHFPDGIPVCELKKLFFKIRETGITVSLPGIDAEGNELFDIIEGVKIPRNVIRVDVPNSKVLVADLRHRFDLPECERLIPLHTPKESYCTIHNEDMHNAAENALKGTGAKLVTSGTLEGCKKFFQSWDIGNAEINIKNSNGEKEKHLAYMDFVTSHDGKIGCQAYDSTVRIVCMNTLRWSLEAAGNVGFQVFHEKNALFKLAHLSELLNAVLHGRKQYKEQMEYLVSVPCDNTRAVNLAMGYFQSQVPDDNQKGVSTRSINQSHAIQDLFARGTGNYGKTLYDLANGATEYWTSGDGTGKNVTMAQKAYKSKFGVAADHKTRFVNILGYDSDKLDEIAEKGRKAYVEYAELNN